MDSSRRMLGINNVMQDVPGLVHEVQVEATFPDGTKLVTVHSPITLDNGDFKLALYGSFLPLPKQADFGPPMLKKLVPIGYVFTPKDDSGNPETVVLNPGKDGILVSVTNTADRPIQVGSHYHFVETNPYLEFDRKIAYGR